MQSRNRYKSSIGFTDLLFNLVIGFVYLFMIAFILINPIAKNADIIKKAEYIIVIEWDQWRNDDIDLWVKDPHGNVVSFINPSAGVMNLEKDDLGYKMDVIQGSKDNFTIIDLNREVVTLRGVVPGEYQVMAHVYARKVNIIDGKKVYEDNTGEGTIRVQLIKINPYYEVYTNDYKYGLQGQQISLLRFTIGEKNHVTDINNTASSFITHKKGDSGYNGYSPFMDSPRNSRDRATP